MNVQHYLQNFYKHNNNIIYINDIRQIKTSEYELLQYADDTVILYCDQSLEKASKRLETAIHEVSFFDQHKLNLNAKISDYLVFCRKHQNQLTQKQSIEVQNETSS